MEQQLLLLINREWTGAALDRVMAVLSSFDFWLAPLGLAVAAMLVFGGFKMRAMLVTLGLIVAVSDGVVADSLKKTIARPRPHEVLADVRIVDLRHARPRFLALLKPVKVRLSRPKPEKIEGRSFPSAHVMNNFCAVVVLAYFYRSAGAAWAVAAAAVAYSRVYVGSHWPSDVVISALMGCGVALLLLPLCEALWRWIGGRAAPGFFARHPTLAGASAAA